MPIISTGTIQRQMAATLGVTTLELNKIASTDDSIDRKIDEATVALNDRPEPFISDSRMSWFFLKDAFRVYLKVKPMIGASRIFNDEKRASESYGTVEEAYEKLLARRREEIGRFKEKYGVDYTELMHYDLVVDTSERTPEEVAEALIAAYVAEEE